VSELSINKKSLKWQCRRGMLELDGLFDLFLEECYEPLTNEQKQAFYNLLQEDDPFIYEWLFCDVPAPQDLEQIVHDIIKWRKTAFRT
jgi:antitoxin CptB